MKPRLPQPIGILVCLLAAAALVGPSVAGVLYQCRTSGEFLGAPCAQDQRSDAACASACCPEPPVPAPESPGECCETVDSEPALPGAPVADGGPEPGLPAETPHDSAEGPAARAATGGRTEDASPPGDPPLFLLHRALLC